MVLKRAKRKERSVEKDRDGRQVGAVNRRGLPDTKVVEGVFGNDDGGSNKG